MKPVTIHDGRRRAAIAAGLRLTAGVALGVGLGPHAARAVDKLAKAAVQYDETTRHPGKDCNDCTQFVPGRSPTAKGSCKIVDGDIDPHGHCIAFTPLPTK